MRGKFSFLYVDICSDVTKCKFIVKISSFKMLVVFSPIFVADTKISFVYNFVVRSKISLYLITAIIREVTCDNLSCGLSDLLGRISTLLPHISKCIHDLN